MREVRYDAKPKKRKPVENLKFPNLAVKRTYIKNLALLESGVLERVRNLSEKTCSKCKKTKSCVDFPLGLRIKDGSDSWCHDCHIMSNRNLKREAMDAYGGKCRCCGEETFEFLTIEHTKKNKRELEPHRKNPGGGPMYSKLKQLGWPDLGLEVLCLNCNGSKGYYGYCPHDTKQK